MIPMQIDYSLQQGLIYGSIFTGYIFLLMITLSPRIWGYSDYPDIIKKKVQPPTRHERTIAVIASIPLLLFALAYPAFSILSLKNRLEGALSFTDAFVHLLLMVIFTTLGDLVILDWLIINKITPEFVIIPGSDVKDYKDFSHHYKGHLKATVILVTLCVLVAFIVSRP
jgi:H+/Cl- antiporter ClcA